MISKIVEQEIRELAPQIVEEFLTEKYLNTLVERKTTRRSSKLEELMANDTDDADEDRIPVPPKNTHDGVYQNKMQTPQSEVVSRLLSNENPWSMVYEGTHPIAGESSPQPSHGFGPEGVPIEKLDGFTEKMRLMSEKLNKGASTRGPMQQSQSAEERRLAEYRAKLDQKVVNTPKVA